MGVRKHIKNTKGAMLDMVFLGGNEEHQDVEG